MKFSTDDSDSDIMNPSDDLIKVALSWLDRGFRPCVIYPRGYPKPGEDKDKNKITIPASGKEPFGFNWGSKPISPKTIRGDIQQLARDGWIPGLGLCLGPGRAPGHKGLMDVEGDGPEAEESRARLFGGEINIKTIGHSSARGHHQFFSYDWDRLQPILARLSGYQKKGAQSGTYHGLPGLPGLELRVGGFHEQGEKKGKLKQLQSVIPPTPGTDDAPRIGNGVDTLIEAPESFYLFLEAMAQVVQEVNPAPVVATNGYHDHETPEAETQEKDEVNTKKKRGRPKGSGAGTSIEMWLRKQFNEKLDKIANAPQGERHPLVMSQLTYLAGYLHCGCGYTHDELELAGIEAADLATPERAGDNPRCVREAIRYGMTRPLELPTHLQQKLDKFREDVGPILPQPSTNGHGPHPPREPGEDDPDTTGSDYELTDLGNAHRLIDLHGDDIRFVPEWKSWYVWNKKYWARDTKDDVMTFRNDVIERIRRDAAGAGVDRGTVIMKWCHQSQSSSHISAIGELARSLPGISVNTDSFDANPWFLNCRNGTIDLEIGKMGPHVRSDMITKIANANYDPTTPSPIWDQFLLDIFDKNLILIDYVQRLVGYSMVGVSREQILIFLSGDGANGKTTFFETIAEVVGDYAYSCNSDLLIDRKGTSQNHSYDLADLFGKRFVFTSDLKSRVSLDEGVIKQITGSDTINARQIYGRPFNFKPTHTVWFSANNPPDIKERDTGIWRRIKRIPFDVVIPIAQRDKELQEKLLRERDGILRWIVEGVAKWKAHKLAEPQIVIDATEEYREETDLFGPFFDDYCDSDPNFKCIQKDLYSDFNYWANTNHLHQVSRKRFGQILKERKYTKDRDNSNRYVIGVRPNGKLQRPGGNRWDEPDFQTPYQPPGPSDL